jgi:hypothetical protein
MKCPSCGAEAKGKFCEYCGSEMPQEKPTVNITNNYYGSTTPYDNTEIESTLGKCPKCGDSKITFKRERVGTATQSRSRKNYIGSGRQGQSVSQSAYRTVGVCQNCGYTWNPNATTKSSGKKTWLWVLGWICIFPLPLTILLLRKKDMKPVVKYGIIAVAWVLFLAIGMSGNSETAVPQGDTPTSYNETVHSDQTTDNSSADTNASEDNNKTTNDTTTEAETLDVVLNNYIIMRPMVTLHNKCIRQFVKVDLICRMKAVFSKCFVEVLSFPTKIVKINCRSFQKAIPIKKTVRNERFSFGMPDDYFLGCAFA